MFDSKGNLLRFLYGSKGKLLRIVYGSKGNFKYYINKQLLTSIN